MADQPEAVVKRPQAASEVPTNAAAQASILDPSKRRNTITEVDGCEVIAPHASGGHTFVVTTVVTETLAKTERSVCDAALMQHALTAVPVSNTKVSSTDAVAKNVAPQRATANANQCEHCECTQAVVPLSTSLPSKLLRFHAKRTAQALLQQASEQSQSLDSQFGSEEGAAGGCEFAANVCADIFDIPTPTAPAMSPVPLLLEGLEEKLIDVGMGSSIEDSEESEEDDELKPLAVDNHVLHDVDLSSPVSEQLSPHELNAATTAVLSEANLEKFRKHHHHHAGQYNHLDNIYLHPNFKYELENDCKDAADASPPPAIAPANSPVEQARVHRSFLTMRKPSATEVDAETANSVISHDTTEANSELPLVNEIDNLDAALVPSEELAAEITEAVEYYFSNESILKDAFLLKHVRRNKEGFVSLKLVSSFKRVRQLAKDWKVVGNAVRRKSRKIELNDMGTKVRRLEPLPNFDETMPSRTIVACDLPLDKLTIEKVSDIFSKCGEIALIRILKPGMAIPVDVRQFMNKYPEMQQKECALVEYLESSSARDARYMQGPFQVFEMVAPKKKTGKKAVIQVAAPVARMVENYRYYNDATYERTRGGSFSGVVPHDTDLRFKLKRNNSDFHPKTYVEQQQTSHGQHYHHQHQHQHQHHSPTHRGSFSNDYTHQFQHYQPRNSIGHEPSSPQSAASPSSNMNFFAYSPRRYSNTSTISANTAALGEGPNSLTQHSQTHISNINNNNNNNNSNNINVNSVGTNTVRRLSNCSDSYSSFSEMSRRPSNCSDNAPQRRDSNCSDNCPCSRRVSDFGQPGEVYRKTSQGSIGSGERRFSNGSMQFERTFSTGSAEVSNNNINMNMNGSGNGSSNGFPRRMSNDYTFDRRQSMETQTGMSYDHDGNVGGGGGGYMVFPRRYSNNFNNVSSKLAAYDNAQYINGRRISTDSGYDRRYSFGSEYEGSPRSRTGSFLNNYKSGVGIGIDYDGQPRSRTGSFLDGSPRSRSGSLAQRNAENLVRTPIGPDGSKGFGSRARKFGQTVSPVN